MYDSFELILVKVVSMHIDLAFACGCPLVPASFAEKTIFASLYFLCSSMKDPLLISMWVYFVVLYSVPLIYLLVLFLFLLLIPHCLDYHSFVVSPKVNPSILFYFHIGLAILDLFASLYKL